MKKIDHTLFDRANVEWDSGRVDAALALFMSAAKSGDTWAYNSIGYFYNNGIGVDKDAKRARWWYRKAAMSGDACGCSNLATQYRDTGDLRRAKKWYRQAVKRGDADAALELGKLYLSAKSTKRAAQYLRIAASSDYIEDNDKHEAAVLLKSLSTESKNNTRTPRGGGDKR